MKVLRHSIPLHQATVAVMGNFDGVHCGHQFLLSAVRAKAKQLNLPIVVIVFEPQTREYFLKDKSPPRLSSLRQKIKVFQAYGVDYVRCLRFNAAMAGMSAIDFAETIIFSNLQVKALFVGEDFRFGCDRLGDFSLLQSIAQRHDAQVERCPDYFVEGQKVSSTRIRDVLQHDGLEDAEKLLGRPYTLCGKVIYGDGLGRTWGVPTANLKMAKGPLPLKGVFVVRVTCENKQHYDGIANIGCRPTLDGKKALLEVHLFQFNGSLYGQRIEVTFLSKLRNEMIFASKEQLIEQIQADVAVAKKYFSVLV